MKIATFNINNINKRLALLLDWLEDAKPDVVCLQELKAADNRFPRSAIEAAGYQAAWCGQNSWNGVAILARGVEPIVTRTTLPGDESDQQSRYIEAAVKGVLIASLYAPNGNPQPGPKFTYKLAWMKRLAAHARDLFGAGAPVVLAGDYNVVPTDFDIYKTKSYAANALVQPSARASLEALMDQGWVDAIRTLHPDVPMYTFWDYMRNRWPRDAGLRLDHLLLNREAFERLDGAGVDRDVRGKENASDHAPVWVMLRDMAQKTSKISPKAVKPRATGRNPPEAVKDERPLLAIDGDSFAHRSYHALPKSIRRGDGSAAGAIVGFGNFLLRLWRAERPRAVIVAWDTLEEPTYRHEALEVYQSGREFDDDLVEQLDALPSFVGSFGFAVAKKAGYEADDFLAAAATAEERRQGSALIATGDRDAFQLASDRVTILFPVKGGELLRVGPAQVRERYGVDPEQVPDFIALRGDPSDKIPGARGVGAKGAATLLQKYGSLEAALKQGAFSGQEKELRLYRSIATMDRKAPLPKIGAQSPTWRKAAAVARGWNLNNLADRIEQLAEEEASPSR